MPTSIKLDPEMKSRLDRLANIRRRSRHWIMQEAIQRYLDQEEARESFKQEALEAWRDYRETGHHLSLEQTTDWLDTWGSEEETEAPECRK